MGPLKLIRFSKSDAGIFSHLLDDQNNVIAVTAEHAYGTPPLPKIYDGTFTCVRGTHQLAHGGPFETFEVTGVEGHSNLLYHPGNAPQVDSSGCILLGTAMSGDMVIESRIAFQKFMDLMDGVQEFQLIVC